MKDTQIKNNKLIIITRRDLSIGIQAVQAGHAAVQFQYEHPELATNWYNNSNYLIFLTTGNEDDLQKLIDKANSSNIQISIFREPDINNQITAIALEPCEQSRKMSSSLPLMRITNNKI